MNVKILLRDISKEVTSAWDTVFKSCPDVEVSCGNIFGLRADAIISPANSFGFMDGGIDLAYTRHFGNDLQERLQDIIRESYFGELPVGNAVIVTTLHKDIKYLISAPSMRLPEDVSQTLNAYLAFRAALIEITKFNEDHSGMEIKSVLCPGIGTLTGLMPPAVCAIQMKKAYDSIIRGIPAFPKSLSEAVDDQLFL